MSAKNTPPPQPRPPYCGPFPSTYKKILETQKLKPQPLVFIPNVEGFLSTNFGLNTIEDTQFDVPTESITSPSVSPNTPSPKSSRESVQDNSKFDDTVDVARELLAIGARQKAKPNLGPVPTITKKKSEGKSTPTKNTQGIEIKPRELPRIQQCPPRTTLPQISALLNASPKDP